MEMLQFGQGRYVREWSREQVIPQIQVFQIHAVFQVLRDHPVQ